MRVYQFAKLMNKDSGDFIHELKTIFNFDIKSHLSNISSEQMEEVKDFYKKEIPTSPKISDMIGKEDEGTIHHQEAMKDTFNMDENIKTNTKTAGEAREQYAKTVKNIAENPKNWSNLDANRQEVIVEKPSWWSRLFSWWSGI